MTIQFEKYYKKNLVETKRKIRDSVTRDLLIIHAVTNIEGLDKAINILMKGLRGWYELYLPEFSKRTFSHERFVDEVLKSDKGQLLKKIELAKEESMGMDLPKEDLKPILSLAKAVQGMYALKKEQGEYLERIMNDTCPEMTKAAGSPIGAKLIVLAGSLKHLAELPSSTIQLLGAEKALFRHLKNKKHPSPKYGIIHEHTLVQKERQSEKGKAARKLAARISIAVKVDYFRKKPKAIMPITTNKNGKCP